MNRQSSNYSCDGCAACSARGLPPPAQRRQHRMGLQMQMCMPFNTLTYDAKLSPLHTHIIPSDPEMKRMRMHQPCRIMAEEALPR